MNLQELIYQATLKWCISEGFEIYEIRDEQCIHVESLSSYFGAPISSLRHILKNTPDYGDPDQKLVYIKHLPHFLCRYTSQSDDVLNKVYEVIGNFGIAAPLKLPTRLYFYKFVEKETGKLYFRMGFTRVLLDTRMNSDFQQVGKHAQGELELIDFIETRDIYALEYQLKERFKPHRVTKFDEGPTVGKESIYLLTSECEQLIKEAKRTHCKTHWVSHQ